MIEITGNLFDYINEDNAAICITTNGTIKKDDKAVMGRGCALEIKKHYPDIDKHLGFVLKKYGNHTCRMYYNIFTIPVKHNWFEKADIELIKRSLNELVDLVPPEFSEIIIPRPGCGNGGLSWNFVKEEIKDILKDDKFMVIDYGK